jgi:hypothetical protein
MMALCGRNMSNLYESIDYVVIQPMTCRAALKTALCVCALIYTCTCMAKAKVEVTLRLAVYRQSVRFGVKPLDRGSRPEIFFLN